MDIRVCFLCLVMVSQGVIAQDFSLTGLINDKHRVESMNTGQIQEETRMLERQNARSQAEADYQESRSRYHDRINDGSNDHGVCFGTGVIWDPSTQRCVRY